MLRHFGGRDELMIAMADRLLREALAGFAPSVHWRDTLTSLAQRVRAACLAHPDVAVLVAARTTARDAEFRGADIVIAALLQAGLAGLEAARYYRALVDLALATSAFEASFNALDAQARNSDRLAWQREYLLASPSQYPHLATVAPLLAEIDAEDQFATIIDLFLDAVELRATRARDRASAPGQR
jgi:hypothetical protein